MNPYFTFSSILACGLYGIKNKLPLTLLPLRTSDATSQGFERLPKTLQEATAKMGAECSMARKVLGDEFVDHYVGTRVSLARAFSREEKTVTDHARFRSKEHEWNVFAAAVTDWEVKRYLELV
jgi:glutamine synthetase